MAREIKFRAWDKINFKMISWNEITDECHNRKSSRLMQYIFTSNDFELMEFANRADRNKKEIYEGDIFGNILQLRCFVHRQYDGAFVVRFIDKRMRDISILGDQIQRSIIQGNIYENPELLNK